MTYRTEDLDAYGQGYAAGKDKAHFEIRHHLGAEHAASCGCEPCITVRAVLAAAGGGPLCAVCGVRPPAAGVYCAECLDWETAADSTDDLDAAADILDRQGYTNPTRRTPNDV